ncbi:hypothetical protein BDD12DRAFT_930625 [Trichophaea hybrida]|nr:hypothetical protein BDD12DRAFT_930625 [Trichophaea hybrida]
MRRRSDSWINATQILKVADFDKPQRTRILEREVQRGVHEKVQGGYGKYQGTWVPLDRARAIAVQYNVDELLGPIFNFRPSTESPPLAPKHITAASTKPRPARGGGAQPTPPTVVAQPPPPPPAPPSVDSYDDDEADNDIVSEIDPLDHPSAPSIGSSSGSDGGMSDADIGDHPSQHSAGMTLKRKRGQMEFDTMSSHRRISYSDELLDYFMTKDIDVPAFLLAPPPDFNVNEVIDTEGHTAIHWAAAMGDLKVIELLCKADANIYATNKRGETPLMRAVLFTNNYDRRSFPRLVETLRDTIFLVDKFGSTVFHHIAATTSSRNKLLAARYYNEVLLQKLSEVHTIDEIAHFLDARDMQGDTALTISARNMAKKCVRTLLGYNASPDIPNNVGETADHLIITAEEQRKNGDYMRASSSSPFQPHDSLNHPYLHQHQQVSQAAATAAAINYAHASHVPQPHTSEAAIAATKKVIPLMAEMLEGLATAFDKELQDKEEDHSQAQRLLDSSTREIEGCRQTSEEILAAFGNIETMNSQIDCLKAEADALASELRRTLERTQYHELTAWVREEEAEVDHSTTPEIPDEKELMDRLHTARELAQAQHERAELMDTIVKAFARSGAGGKMGDYRRLIALSCSLLPDDVEKLLPEILKDLEAGGDGSQGLGLVDGLV